MGNKPSVVDMESTQRSRSRSGSAPRNIETWTESDTSFKQYVISHRDNSLLRELNADPESATYYPNQQRRPVRSGHYVAVVPRPLQHPQLVLYSSQLALQLGLSESQCQSQAFAHYLSGDVDIAEQKDGWATPYNKSWCGRFIGYNVCPFGDGCGYGDGRAISVVELVTSNGERWELQLKGAGTTPFCRGADGCAVLRSSVREFIVSEAMHALGVPTARALSLIASGSMQVQRSHPTGGRCRMELCAITCRAATSFVRIGSFELFGRRLRDAAKQFPGARAQLISLVQHTLSREFGGPDNAKDSPGVMAVKLLMECAGRVATTTSEWLRVGFCQGNFQSDNCLVSGRTIDYGPFSWVEKYDPQYCSWNGDSSRDFAFMDQVETGFANVVSLFEALLPVIDHIDHAILAENLKEQYWRVASEVKNDTFRRKLGLEKWTEQAAEVLEELLRLMHRCGADYTITFRQLAAVLEAPQDAKEQLQRLRLKNLSKAHAESWMLWLRKWLALVESSGPGDIKSAAGYIRRSSPKYVPREWMLIEAYTAAEKGDYRPAQEILSLLMQPYDEWPEMEEKYYKAEVVQPMS